jgi:hypothetical protein
MEACKHVAWSLGVGEPLRPEDRDHAANCSPCKALQARHDDLEALMASEPCLAAPDHFASSVLGALRALRRREVRAARIQVLVAVAAAALLAVLATWLETAPAALGPEAQAWLPDGAALYALALETVDSLGRGLEASATQALEGLPSPPLVLLLLLAPVLLACNWTLARPTGRTA